MSTKKPKKAPEPFTEKKLFVWLRSALRSASRRYPPIYEALAAAKEPYIGTNTKQKVCYRCAACNNTFPSKEVAVDHRVDCGCLASWEDVQGFVQRLFCAKEGLDILCHDCHDAKTYSTKYGVSLSEAKLMKDVLAICKKPVKEILAFCLDYGYNEQELSNAVKRKAAVTAILSSVK